MYIQQAYKGGKGWWRYLITFLVVIVAKMLSEMPLSTLATKKALENNDLGNLRYYLDAHVLGLSDNQYFLLMFAPQILVFGALVACMFVVHGYTLIQIFTSYKTYRWKNFFGAAFIWLLLLASVEIASYFIKPDNYSITFDAKQFFPLLFYSLLFVPFQASAEELYFRGNLMQGFGLLSRSRIFAILFTGTLFGAMHMANPEVAEYGKLNAMIQYIGFGVLLGVIVVMDGGLEMAFGMHTINNIYLVTMVSYSGSVVKTPAMFHTKHMDANLMTIGFLIAAVLYVVILKKVFKWRSFGWLAEPVKNG